MAKSRKRVALIAYYYPPSPAVGGLRAEKLARAFQKAGHEVLVITARLPGEKRAIRLREPGLEVRAIRSIPNPRFWYLALKKKFRGRRDAPPSGGESGNEVSFAAPVSVPAWKRLIGAILWLPDDSQGFILSAFLAVVGRRRFDLIYTSAPPFSAHLAGLLVKWARRAPWAAEFRDPWTDNPWKPAHVRTGFTQSVERWLESRVLASANHIVAVSEGIRTVLVRKLAEDRQNQCLLIRNGITRLNPSREPRVPGPFRIVHVGSFYHGRNPQAFLSALARLVAERGLGADQLQVDLVGNCRWFNGVSIENEVASLGLGSVVRFTDWVTHQEAQSMIARADLLLLLAQDQPLQVPNKLYEYLGTRIPILAFADEEGESSAILREAGGHFVVSSTDPLVVEGVVRRALAPDESGDSITPSSLEEMTVDRQMNRLIESVLPD